MTENYQNENKIQLSDPHENYDLEFDLKPNDKIIMSAVNHRTQEWFFEYFKNDSDFIKYLKKSKGNFPLTIKCTNHKDDPTINVIDRCKKLQKALLPITIIQNKKTDSNMRENIDFYHKYKRIKK